MMTKATIHFENGEKIFLELFEDAAPNTVKNFVKLAEEKFYDGLTFHRVIPISYIQGGGPIGDGTGGPGYTIKCETEGNPHKHERGSLSMAHAGRDTGGSQFFICHSPQPHLDGVPLFLVKWLKELKSSIVYALATLWKKLPIERFN